MSNGSSNEQQDTTRRLLVNGLTVEVPAEQAVVRRRLLPALRALRPAPGHRRAFVFVAGPPGTGKSTLAELARHEASEEGLRLDVVGLDGFHHRQSYLDTHCAQVGGRAVRLADVKGAPESFDLRRFQAFLARTATEDVAWPAYSRTLHDVVDDAVPVTGDVVLVEGNWLMLDEPGWRDLARWPALRIFLDAPAGLLRERLIGRKVAGGLSRADAEAFYEASDRRNVARCLGGVTGQIDITLRALPDGTLHDETQHDQTQHDQTQHDQTSTLDDETTRRDA